MNKSIKDNKSDNSVKAAVKSINGLHLAPEEKSIYLSFSFGLCINFNWDTFDFKLVRID